MRTMLELSLSATPKAAPELRRELRAYDYDIRLCATELLTNVIDHVGDGTPVTVRVTAAAGDADRTRIEVRDPNTRTLPVIRAATETQEYGRGLTLVAALAERWGVDLGPDGKTVWCELAPASSC
ncbi:ATP-binding protein [Streptomyces sp. LP11]|uniref:ATP-binding protein n=1 Tax=Streptomyces pyxinicus TaxID=2970331 RepID=A0ABT2B9P2_9ACTN|nr:ATP-binding protein [Streptomyces sp. LP11]MCS0605231.1 ATP-binding protein [Streptomyces sp. LP11]